jgi:hypothetical protein
MGSCDAASEFAGFASQAEPTGSVAESESKGFARQLALGAAVALAALSACAQPLIQDGAIREDFMRDIVANTARARAIEPKGPITARAVNRDELLAILSEAFDKWKTPAELADYERALIALGLWPAGRDLYAEALAVYGEEIVGIYVPSSEELLLVSNARAPRSAIPERERVTSQANPKDSPARSPVSERGRATPQANPQDSPASGLESLSAVARRNSQTEFALSHEIIHLLQHQAYPELMDPDWMPKNSDDLEAAIQAALEGDAMRFSFDAIGLRAPMPEEWMALLDGQFPGLEGSALAEAPALIRLTFDFPYARGYAMAWREKFSLLESPPISTEQALHDDRRLEAFLQMDLTELEDRLPADCRTLQRNTVGELQISALFRDLSEGPNPAIWGGWNGDRYLVADCAGRTEWVWWTAWDSETDAAEFADAYFELAPAVAARASSKRPVLARVGATYVVVTSSGFAEEASKPPPPATRVADLVSLQALLHSTEKRALHQ